jgi:hypothetical protein
MTTVTRKSFIQSLMVLPAAFAVRLRAAGTPISVWKTPTCGCCGQWVAHMRTNGFDVQVQDVPNTTPYRAKYGVPDAMQSCHTAIVEGHPIEGHVPAADIRRLLKDGPKGAGLAVPGMVAGSPGMEGGASQPYSVMMFTADGKTSIFQKYPGSK